MRNLFGFFLCAVMGNVYSLWAQPNKAPVSKSGIEWKTLQTPIFSIQYPSNWELKENVQTAIPFILFSPLEGAGDKFRENINLVVQDLSGQKMDLKKYVEVSEKQVKELIKNSRIIESKRVKKGTNEFHKIIYTGNSNNFLLQFEQHYYIVKEKAYVLTYTAEQSKFESFLKTGERILNSFVIGK